MRSRIFFILSAVLTGILLFYNLGQARVERWDEQTNISVVRELLMNSRFPALTFNGRPFLEKPPLWYWVTAGLSSFTGLTVTSARLTSAVSGLLILSFVYVFGSMYFSRQAGLISALTLLSASQLFISGNGGFFSTHTLRSADSDSLFLLFFTASVFFFVAGLTKLKNGWIPGAVSTALAVLTKGPSGVIPLAAYALFLILRNPKRMAAARILPPVLVATAIILPWHLFMYARVGDEFLKTYAGYHLLLRLTSGIEGHNNPWWYYVKVLISFSMFPAFPVAAYSLLMLIAKKTAVSRPELAIPLLSLVLYAAVIFAAQTRLAWYVLPIYPLVAMISGWWLADRDARTDKYSLLMTVYLLGFAVRNVCLLP